MNVRYRALLIGNSTFPKDPENLKDLQGPVNDLRALAQALTDPLTGLFADADVQALLDWERNPVEEELEDFFRKAGRGDVLLLYYSGHGYRDTGGQLYLSVKDTKTQYLTSALSSERITHLRDSWAPTGTLIIILDCCHSGAHKSGIFDLAEPLEGSGRYVIASCSAGRTSPDASGKDALSPFTERLVQGLIGAPATDRLTIDDLWEYLTGRCRDDRLPIPQRSFAGQGTVQFARRARAEVSSALSVLGSTESRNTLPGRVDCFTGRDEELEWITHAIRRKEREPTQTGPTVVIRGPACVGKTALATMIAHKLSSYYSYTYFIDLLGWRSEREPLSTQQALEDLLSFAGLSGTGAAGGRRSHQALLGRWRDWTSTRRVLLVLDNAADAEQIEGLLPGSSECLTIITSRDDLQLGNISRPLRPLSSQDSAALFHQIVEQGTELGSGFGEEQAVQQILEHTHGFPLIIKIMAHDVAQSGTGGATEIAAGLSSGALNGLGPIETYFEVTYDRLDPAVRKTFGRLGLFPGSTITAFAAALLTGNTEPEARELLRRLSNSGMLERRGTGIYRLHDYLAEFAKNHAPRDEYVRGQVSDALLGGYLAATTAAARLTGHVSAGHGNPSPSTPSGVNIPATPKTAQAWLAGERDNIVALITHANDPKLIQLTEVIGPVLRRSGYFESAQLCYERAHSLAEQDDNQIAFVGSLNGRGAVALSQGRYDDAERYFQQATQVAQLTGDQINHANALNGRGEVARMQGRYDDADQHFRQAADLAQQTGDRFNHANALNGRGEVARMQGRYDDADEHFRQAADLAQETGDQINHANALNGRGHLAFMQDRYDDADQHFRQAADLAQQTGDQINHANTVNGRGHVAFMQDRYDDAERYFQQAITLAQQTSDRITHARALNGLGDLARLQNRYDDADGYYQQAITLTQQTSDYIIRADALYGRGLVAVERDQTALAHELLGESLRLYEVVRHSFAATVHETLARLG